MAGTQIEQTDIETQSALSCQKCRTDITCAVQDLNNSISTLSQTIRELSVDLCHELAELKVALITDRQNENSSAELPCADAGQRLVQVTELLEKVLVHLPSLDLLFAQRVNLQFRVTIIRSEQLQRRLFFFSGTDGLVRDPVILNPIVSRSAVLQCLPVYLDANNLKLAYVPRKGRCRVFGKTARVITDPNTNQDLVHLDFSSRAYDDQYSCFRKAPSSFKAGSWKNMSLSQPICGIIWRIVVHEKREVHLYHCTTAGASSLDGLLDTMATATLQHSTMSSHDYQRERDQILEADNLEEDDFMD